MPAHLESTDRAMKAEKARIGQDRQATRMEDQDKDDRNDVAASDGPKKQWRARMNAAVILKQKTKKRLDTSSDEKGSDDDLD